jgi:hypothetical protein
MYAVAEHALVASAIAEADCLGQASFEARLVCKNGSSYPAQTDVTNVRDADGQLS